MRGVRVPPVENRPEPKYPFTSEGSAGGVQAVQRGDPALRPDLGHFSQTNWVLKGKSLTTDPTKTELGKAINGQQSVDKALENIVAGYNQQVGGGS